MAVSQEVSDLKAYHINQRDEGIDLHGVSGALMATTNMQKYSSDRDTLRVECKSAVFHADFLLLRLSRFGNSTGLDASS